jgi:peptidylprolyl isomerase domain and WD repeat-containing protein 1
MAEGGPVELEKTLVQVLLDEIPQVDRYERSYMHRDVVGYVLASSKLDLVLTMSLDGHLKIWRKVHCLI